MKIIQNFLVIIFCSGIITTKQLIVKKDFKMISNTYDVLILKYCKKDYQNILVSIGSNDIDLKWLQNLHPQFSVILHSKMNIIPKKENFNWNYSKKIDTYVFIIKEIMDLKNAIDNLKKLVWWNAMTPFYLINIHKNNCLNSKMLLRQIWTERIVNPYYICLDERQIIKIVTYNPFSNRAPKPWTKGKKKIRRAPWTMYERKYTSDKRCENLDFDRTEHLDGYQITVALQSLNPNTSKTSNLIIGKSTINHIIQVNSIKLIESDEILLNALITFLNVTIRLFFFKEEKFSFDTQNAALVPQRKKIFLKSSADLILQRIPLNHPEMSHPLSPFKKTYSMAWSKNGIVTYNRGYQTLMEKLWNFYGIWTILFTFFILLTTFIVIWLVGNQKFAFASFEIIRLLINHNLYTRINTLSLKIFFVTIFIYFIVIQATFHGHLAKFLTIPQLRRHAEALEDLPILGLTAYDIRVEDLNMTTKVKRHLTVDFMVNKCLTYVLNEDPLAACVNEYSVLYKEMKHRKNFYISKKPFGTYYDQFSISRECSLKDRLGMIFLLLQDLGFWKFLADKSLYQLLHNDTIFEARLDKKFRPITFENLLFSFMILSVGLTLAAISFCFEVCFCKLFNMISNFMRYLRNLIRNYFISFKKLAVWKFFYKRKVIAKKVWCTKFFKRR